MRDRDTLTELFISGNKAEQMDALYERLLAWAHVTKSVQCPEVTCKQAAEIEALLLHMNERATIYANQWGADLGEAEKKIEGLTAERDSLAEKLAETYNK